MINLELCHCMTVLRKGIHLSQAWALLSPLGLTRINNFRNGRTIRWARTIGFPLAIRRLALKLKFSNDLPFFPLGPTPPGFYTRKSATLPPFSDGERVPSA